MKEGQMSKETTSWNEMANNLVQTWSETGTQMWKSWFDLMSITPIAEPLNEVKPTFKDVALQFINNQELMGNFLKLSFNAWKDLLPTVESGGNWQQDLSHYTEKIRQRFDDYLAGTLKVSQDVSQLWQLYLKESQKFNQLWATAWTSSLGPLSQTVTGASEPWIELNNLYWNLLYEETFGSLMQSPILGPSREFNGKLLRAFNAWTQLYRASIDYQVLLTNVQVRSFETLMRELVVLAQKGERVENWRQFQDIWSRVADDVFAEAFCNEDNLKIRGQFLNTLNTYRLHQQELMELWMRPLNMPLRTEVDEMHKSIYELRKEVKALKKALANYEAREQSTAVPIPTDPPQEPAIQPDTPDTSIQTPVTQSQVEDEITPEPDAQPPVPETPPENGEARSKRTSRRPRTV
jgi:class III poly(R)-hydroxyalkanoic acid synthase PhaE subunit